MTFDVSWTNFGALATFLDSYAAANRCATAAVDALTPLFSVAERGRFEFWTRRDADQRKAEIQESLRNGFGDTGLMCEVMYRYARAPFLDLAPTSTPAWQSSVRERYATHFGSWCAISSTSATLYHECGWRREHEVRNPATERVRAMIRFSFGAALEYALEQSVDPDLLHGEFAKELKLWHSIETLLTAYVVAAMRNLACSKNFAVLVEMLPHAIPISRERYSPQRWQVLVGD